MIVQYGNQHFECSILTRKVGNIRIGDLILDEDNLVRVETIQQDCIDFHNHLFVMLISRTATGSFITHRGELKQTTTVWRPKKEIKIGVAA